MSGGKTFFLMQKDRILALHAASAVSEIRKLGSNLLHIKEPDVQEIIVSKAAEWASWFCILVKKQRTSRHRQKEGDKR